MRKLISASSLLVLSLLVLSPVARAQDGASAPSGGSNAPSNQTLLYHSQPGTCRDCFAAGITLRASGTPGGPGASGVINVPANVAANAVFAQLFWGILDDQVPPNTETFNGTVLARIPSGPVTVSPCWPIANAYAYRADVLPLLQAGANTLSLFPDSGSPSIAPSTEGASLVVVFNTQTIDKEIFVFNGNDPVGAALLSSTLNFPPIGPVGIGADLTFIVADGQLAGDEAYWNGIALDNGDAFLGLDPGPGIGFWDTSMYGVGIDAANSTTVESQGDCLNWIATVLCTKRGGCVVPTEPSTWGKIKNMYR